MRKLIIEYGIRKTLQKEKIQDIKWRNDFKIVIGKYINNNTNVIPISNVWNSINSSIQKKVTWKK